MLRESQMRLGRDDQNSLFVRIRRGCYSIRPSCKKARQFFPLVQPVRNLRAEQALGYPQKHWHFTILRRMIKFLRGEVWLLGDSEAGKLT